MASCLTHYVEIYANVVYTNGIGGIYYGAGTG